MIEYKQIIADYTHHNKLLNKIKFYDFMNHGYDPVSNLLDKDFIMKREASLYLKLLENIDTNNKNILDVGCGRGGGVALYKKYFNFKNVYGCDITDVNIDYAKLKHKDINFKVANAENLTYDKNTFDIITNVESMSLYIDQSKFLKNVIKLLKPDGLFICTDCSYRTLETFYKNKHLFKSIEVKDITDNVATACLKNIQEYSKWKDSEVKTFTLGMLEEKYENYFNRKDVFNIFYCAPGATA
jgi:ubiquinone/menaquinone biosynthesis C-methylase UbiE